MATKKANPERDEAINLLRKILRPGDRLYTILGSVSKSGMSRTLRVIIVPRKIKSDVWNTDGRELVNITGYVAKACGFRTKDVSGWRCLVIGGCGMDAGFEVAYILGRTLWPKGFKLAKGQYGRNGNTSRFDEDGGYALKHSWL